MRPPHYSGHFCQFLRWSCYEGFTVPDMKAVSGTCQKASAKVRSSTDRKNKTETVTDTQDIARQI